MRVLQVGGGPDLAQETFCAERGGEVRVENLHRDTTRVLEILGEVDGSHAALAELTLDAVSVGERISQRRDAVVHEGAVASVAEAGVRQARPMVCRGAGIRYRVAVGSNSGRARRRSLVATLVELGTGAAPGCR
jgi:hypothetical protein